MPSRSSVIHPTHPHVTTPAAYIQAPAPLILCPPPPHPQRIIRAIRKHNPFSRQNSSLIGFISKLIHPHGPRALQRLPRPLAAGRSLESPEPQPGPPPQFQHSHYIQVSYSSRSDGRRETVPAGHRRPLNRRRIDGKFMSGFLAVRGLHGGAEVDTGAATWWRSTCVYEGART